jgi:7,8-dihydropterin-6-yl-methyl-4-(beta-D-ribofuranosyl)aminobenzene 5'-phosphate synthase
VNIVRHAKLLTGVDQLHAVLGGFHLRGADIIPRTVSALAAESPAVVVPAHCTSWIAQSALAAGMPDAYRPNPVGSSFDLRALDRGGPVGGGAERVLRHETATPEDVTRRRHQERQQVTAILTTEGQR